MLILDQVCIPVGKLKAALMRFQAAVSKFIKFVLITPPKYSLVVIIYYSTVLSITESDSLGCSIFDQI